MTSRVRVKICGITRGDDARLAVRLGADAIGFVFWNESPRVITPDAARDIARHLPALTTRVGVFVNARPEEVSEVVRHVGLDIAQLHGDEDLLAYHGLHARIMRVVTLTDDASADRARRMEPEVLPLVDASDAERRGGTGRTADWTRAATLARERPIVLAGGLTAGNVGAAIGTVQPWAVDVSSGVESEPGIKSADRLREFFAAVERAQKEAQ